MKQFIYKNALTVLHQLYFEVDQELKNKLSVLDNLLQKNDSTEEHLLRLRNEISEIQVFVSRKENEYLKTVGLHMYNQLEFDNDIKLQKFKTIQLYLEIIEKWVYIERKRNIHI